MASPWEQQVKEFLQRAGTELRRTSEEMKGEAQRLMEELRDPSRQAKVREQFDELRVWARKATNEATRAVDVAVRKVESALTNEPKAKKAPKASAEEKAPKAAEPKPAAKKTVGKAAGTRAKAPAEAPAKKTVGKAAGTKTKAKAPAKAAKEPKAPKAPAKKTVGRKKPAAS